ncbi:MAG: ribosomal-processing cysteine protease Prp [Ruminococcaceae bacterium]|nr:ribosomal-processing cysteine protease Prp [Oscillospiraceae bacterium]
MIRSEFVIRDNKVLAFSVEGHSGLAEAGSDVLCASVSAMAMLVINTLSEVFSAELDLEIDDAKPVIRCTLKNVSPEAKTGAEGVLYGFYLQMKDLAEVYPKNLSIRTKK